MYIINDVVGASLLLYSSLILGMYGWILGVILLIVVWPVNLYTAHLLWRCRNVFPGAISIGDLVYYITRSSVAMYVAFFFVNATILLTLVSQMEVAASNIYWFFALDVNLSEGECYIAFTALIAVALIPLTQLRYLHSLTLMNIVNIVCMLVFVCVTVYMLASGGRTPGAETDLKPEQSALDGEIFLEDGYEFGPILGLELLFGAYYYQVIILEIIAEMKDPAEFPKANYWSTPIVLFAALVTATTQYYYLGEDEEIREDTVEEVLQGIFDRDGDNKRPVVAYIAVVCFTVHMLGCCLIRSIILTRSLQLLFNPVSANRETWRTRLAWALISVFVLALAFVLTLFVNQLGLLSISMGFLTLITCILLPIVLYLVCCFKREALRQIPKIEWAAIVLISAVALVVFVINCIKSGQRYAETSASEFRNITMTELQTELECSSFQLM